MMKCPFCRNKYKFKPLDYIKSWEIFKSFGSTLQLKCDECNEVFFLYLPFNLSLILKIILILSIFGFIIGGLLALFHKEAISALLYYASNLVVILIFLLFLRYINLKLGYPLKKEPEKSKIAVFSFNFILALSGFLSGFMGIFIFYPGIVRFGVWYTTISLEKPGIARICMDIGFDVNQSIFKDPKMDLGYPLNLAIQLKKKEMAKFLLQNQARINQKDLRGNSPLHDAMSHSKDTELVKYLIQKGAKVNLKNGKGHTPLHYAVFTKNKKFIQILMKKGGNPFIKDKKGKTAKDYALKTKMKKVVRYFNKYRNKFKKR
ncbi:ankyrin repeat domain-containing protein [Candidatus Riflebacteria bacterium]